jgi:hypothetical protein
MHVGSSSSRGILNDVGMNILLGRRANEFDIRLASWTPKRCLRFKGV